MKTQVENGLSKIFYFRFQTIDMSDQSIFNLKDSGLHNKEVNRINISDPLTAAHRSSSRFLLFMMMIHPDQADPNCNHSRMTCMYRFQLLLDIDGIYDRINTQILKPLIIF